MFDIKEVKMKHFRVFATIILSVGVCISLSAPAFSAEAKPDQTQRPRESQKPPSSIQPDLSCYFAQELNGGMELWVQNNAPGKSTWFNVHYEAVKDGVKVLDSNFFVSEASGNHKTHELFYQLPNYRENCLCSAESFDSAVGEETLQRIYQKH